MAHSVKAFTKDKLHKMEASGRVPANLDRDQDAEGDNFGFTAARSSNSAQLKHGGAAHKPHLGRAHRASGGKVDHSRKMNEASVKAVHLGDAVKLPIPEKARGGKVHDDEAEDRALVKKMVKPEARTGQDRGGRTHNAAHRHHRASGGGVTDEELMMPWDEFLEKKRQAYWRGQEYPKLRQPGEGPRITVPRPASTAPKDAEEKRGGRVNRASGGRTGKAKTVVNVIIAGRGNQQPAAPMPAPMPASPPPMPPVAPPPRPPMAMPPVGPMVGSPPMPMRARGGKVDGHYAFGEGGTPKQAKCKETYGAGGGKGRMEKAARERSLAGIRPD